MLYDLHTGRVGSPPRVRGKVQCVPRGVDAMGITPACAGKRKAETTFAFAIRDHPRVCGEKDRTASMKEILEGSPPRVRGKALRLRQLIRAAGITPACAGKRNGLFLYFWAT